MGRPKSKSDGRPELLVTNSVFGLPIVFLPSFLPICQLVFHHVGTSITGPWMTRPEGLENLADPFVSLVLHPRRESALYYDSGALAKLGLEFWVGQCSPVAGLSGELSLLN